MAFDLFSKLFQRLLVIGDCYVFERRVMLLPPPAPRQLTLQRAARISMKQLGAAAAGRKLVLACFRIEAAVIRCKLAQRSASKAEVALISSLASVMPNLSAEFLPLDAKTSLERLTSLISFLVIFNGNR